MTITPKNKQNQQVDIIPATKRHIEYGDQFRSQANLRVAAYCRVSTEEESQQNSYESQKNHYTTLILNHPGWEMVDIYADEGKSGTSRKKRQNFNRMIADAQAGKLDYIITKSISRFARNTIDALDCVHNLQRLHPPVGVYFERENIDTLNANSEMFLTFYCSMAQEESHSISENIKWSIRKKMAAGEPHINLSRMLGYDLGTDGSWIVNQEQAVIIQHIFKRYLQGISANAIAKELNESGRLTVNNKNWRADTIFNILRNEKYAGDLLMQKTYTESFLTHKTLKNTGELPQYYKCNHHPAIIDRITWNETQTLLDQRQQRKKHQTKKVKTDTKELEISAAVENLPRKRGPVTSPFHSLLLCAGCESHMKRMRYNSTRKGAAFSYAVWKCPKSPGKPGTNQQGRTCQASTLTEISMEQSFMEMLYQIKHDYRLNGENSEIVRNFQSIYNSLRRKEPSSGFIEEKRKILEMEIEELSADYQKACQKAKTALYASRLTLGEDSLIRNNMYNAIADKITFTEHAETLKKRLRKKKEEQNRLIEEHSGIQNMKQNFENFLQSVTELPDIHTLETPQIPFKDYILRNYFLKIKAWGNNMDYYTTFGLTLTATGNERSIQSYID